MVYFFRNPSFCSSVSDDSGSIKAAFSRALLSSEVVRHLASFTRSVCFPETCQRKEHAVFSSYVGDHYFASTREPFQQLRTFIFTRSGRNRAQLHTLSSGGFPVGMNVLQRFSLFSRGGVFLCFSTSSHASLVKSAFRPNTRKPLTRRNGELSPRKSTALPKSAGLR